MSDEIPADVEEEFESALEAEAEKWEAAHLAAYQDESQKPDKGE